MALPVWPATLPQCAMVSSDKTDPALVSSEMNSGVVRQRQRFSQPIRLVDVSYRMDATQLAVFKTFLQSLGNGSGLFTGPVPNGFGKTVTTCQIVNGAVAYERIGPIVRVSFQLRTIGML